MIHDLLSIAGKPAVTCPDATPLSQVARLMSEHTIGAVMVLDSDQHLAGVVTDRDLAVRGLGQELPAETPVREVMSHDVVSVHQAASSLDAVRQMANRDCRRLPIIDDHGSVIGVVALDDIMRAEGAVTEQIQRLLGVERAERRRARL